MKQYEILWVPVDSDSSKKSTRIETNCGTLDAIENSIVLTMEDLRELCNHMVKEWVKAVEGGFAIEEEVSEDLDKYLESKGVQL